MTLRRTMIRGTWTLQSYIVVDDTGQTIAAPLGEDAIGHLIYTDDGFMSAQLMRRERSDQDADATGYLAYTGPFDFDEATSTLYHHVDVSLLPNWVGGQQVRHAILAGDLLILSGDVSEEFGVVASARLTWRRPGATSTKEIP